MLTQKIDARSKIIAIVGYPEVNKKTQLNQA